MRRRTIVSANVPAGVEDADLAAYVAEALKTWGGQYRPPSDEHPGHPLFDDMEVRQIIIRNTTFTN